ncbi:hypothetical protein JKP88DRAFT_255696, partial [Tribonema minus]
MAASRPSTTSLGESTDSRNCVSKASLRTNTDSSASNPVALCHYLGKQHRHDPYSTTARTTNGPALHVAVDCSHSSLQPARHRRIMAGKARIPKNTTSSSPTPAAAAAAVAAITDPLPAADAGVSDAMMNINDVIDGEICGGAERAPAAVTPVKREFVPYNPLGDEMQAPVNVQGDSMAEGLFAIKCPILTVDGHPCTGISMDRGAFWGCSMWSQTRCPMTWSKLIRGCDCMMCGQKIPAGVPVMGMSALGRGRLKGFMNIHEKVDMCVGKLVDGDSPFAFEALVENRCGHCGEPIEAGTTQVVAGIKGDYGAIKTPMCGCDVGGDADGDQVCDDEDKYLGMDNTIDGDGDTVPDGADQCEDMDDTLRLTDTNVESLKCLCLEDFDRYGVCDLEDIKPGYDDQFYRIVDTNGQVECKRDDDTKDTLGLNIPGGDQICDKDEQYALKCTGPRD